MLTADCISERAAPDGGSDSTRTNDQHACRRLHEPQCYTFCVFRAFDTLICDIVHDKISKLQGHIKGARRPSLGWRLLCLPGLSRKWHGYAPRHHNMLTLLLLQQQHLQQQDQISVKGQEGRELFADGQSSSGGMLVGCLLTCCCICCIVRPAGTPCRASSLILFSGGCPSSL